MCFSATGSFAVSGVLTGLGAAAIIRNKSPRHRLFAATPLLFAAQQAIEGLVWLTIDDPDRSGVHRLAVTMFLAFALAVWPVWMPLSLRFIEHSDARARLLNALVALGAAASAYALVLLWRDPPVARVAGHSLSYDYHLSQTAVAQIVGFLGYAVPSLLPFFVSTASMARTVGGTLLGSLALSIIVQRDAFASVWCFFAAIISGLILLALEREQARSLQARLVETRP